MHLVKSPMAIALTTLTLTIGSLTTAIAAPIKAPKITTPHSHEDLRVGSKVRQEIQYIYQAINQTYIKLNDKPYVSHRSGGCAFYEVKSLTLDSFSQEQAELTIEYNRYNCGFASNDGMKQKMYLYNVSGVDVFREKLSVRKDQGIWKISK